jgi:hypothetical protein
VKTRLLGLALGIGLGCACSGHISGGVTNPDDPDDSAEDAAAACTASLPASCPAAPSFATTIAPIMQRTCATCHVAGGVAADRDLTSYAHIAELETTELIQLYSCQMPPPDAGPSATLAPAEREQLLQWFVCGFPDN